MSTEIDSKVVEMRFDNKQFETNVATSMSTIEKLKRSLNLSGASKGLENVSSAAKNCNLTSIGAAVETIQSRFSTFGVVATTVLANITNSAVNCGKRIVSALTIDAKKQGFDEYELKMGSIQTIMMSTGASLSEVNKYLQDLNTYSDRTIYSFQDMTSNIGKFTNAGVKLEDAVMAIKGVSNEAAVSGANANEASRAMYNFAQALSAGYVKLIDWKSIENANMATVEFKNQLLESAVACGTLKKTSNGMYKVLGTNAAGKTMDEAIDATHNFNDSLQYQWMTTEALVRTLRKYADETTEIGKKAFSAAQEVKTFSQLFDTLKEAAGSGWANTWEILIGDFEEAKSVLTQVSDVIGNIISESANARNELLSGGLSSGWKQLMDAGIGDEAAYIDSIKEVARAQGDAFDDIISKSDSFSNALKQGFQEGVISSQTLSDAVFNLRDKISGMSDEELKNAGYTREMATGITELASSLENGSVSMDEFVSKIMRPSGRENIIQGLWNAAKGLMSVIKPIKAAFSEIFPPLTADAIYNITEGFSKLTASLILSDAAAEKVKTVFKGLFSVISTAVNIVTSFARGAVQLVRSMSPMGEGLLSVSASMGNFLTKTSKAIDVTNLFGSIFGIITSIISPAAEVIKKALDGLALGFEKIGGLSGILEKAISGISAAFSKIKNVVSNAVKNLGFDSLLDTVNGGLTAGILLGIKKFIKSLTELISDGPGFVSGINEILEGVAGSLKAFQASIKVNSLRTIATAIGILAAALAVISSIDEDKMSSSLSAIAGLFAELFISIGLFEKIMGGKGFKAINKVSKAMISLSLAVLILSAAMKNISSLSWEELGKGLLSVGVLMGELVGAAVLMSKFAGDFTKSAVGLIVFSAAVAILANVVKSLSSLSWEELGKGLLSVGGLLTGLALFLNKTKLDGMSMKNGIGILALSAAILVLSSAVEKLGAMDLPGLVKGLGSIGILLVELWAFMKFSGDPKNIISTAVGMTIMGSAMLIFASAISKLGGMSWEEIGKGLTSIGASLLAVTLSMRKLPDDMMTKSVAMIGVAAALVILSNALQSMGGMSWEEIGKGLATLGGSLLIITVALNKMSKDALPGAAALLVVAAALAILAPVMISLSNISWEGIGRGLTALAGTFLVIGVAAKVLGPMAGTIALFGAAIAAVGAGCLVAGAGLLVLSAGLSALAVSGTAGVAALIAIIEGVIELVPTIATAIATAIISVITTIGSSAADIATAFAQILNGILDVIISVAPQLASTFVTIIGSILEAITTLAPKIASTFVTIIGSILEAITTLAPKIASTFVTMIGSILEAITTLAPKIASTFVAVFKSILSAISDIVPEIVDTVITCLEAILDGIVDFVPKMIVAGCQIITGVLQGIADNIGGVAEAGTNIIVEFLSAVGQNLPRIIDAGFNMMINFINGLAEAINANTGSLTAAIGNLIGAVINAGISLLTSAGGRFLTAGGNAMNSLRNGISSKMSSVVSAIQNIASNMVSGLKAKVSEFTSIGSNIVSGIKNGISSAWGNLKSWFSSLFGDLIGIAKKILGIHSPSRAFMAIGRFIGEGLAKGIRESAQKAVNASEEMADRVASAAAKSFEDVKKWVEDAKAFDELSLEEELEIWEAMISKYAEGTEERTEAEKNAYSVYKELRKNDYQNSMDWIEREKYYNRLSLKEELAAYERVQSRYKKGSEEWTNMEKEKYRVKNEIAEASYQHSMDWIEEEQYYNRLSLYDELAAYKRVQSRYAKGTDEYEKMAKEIYRVQNEITKANKTFYDESLKIQQDYEQQAENLEKEHNAKIKEIEDQRDADIKAANDSYDDALKSRADSLYSSYSLFDSVEKKEEVSASTLIGNLQDQVDEFKDWQTVLNSLSARGLNDGLIEELQEMGPSAISEIKALNSMSDSQLQQYAVLWGEKHELAKTKATDELKDLRTETDSTITAIRTQAKQDMEDAIAEYEADLAELNTTTSEQLNDLRNEWTENMGLIRSDTTNEFTMMADEIAEIIGDQNDWSELGGNIIEGLVKGIIDTENDLLEAIKRVFTSMKGTAAESVDAHSPSRDFAKLGTYCMQGLALGIKDCSKDVMDATRNVGEKTLSTMSQTIEKIADCVNDELDSEPVIKPIVDLSNVQNGMNRVDGLLCGRTLTLSIGAKNSFDEINRNNVNENTASMEKFKIDKVISAIDSLRSDFNDMAAKLESMQVVLDGDALVGEMAPKMDNALGGLARMNRRGLR